MRKKKRGGWGKYFFWGGGGVWDTRPASVATHIPAPRRGAAPYLGPGWGVVGGQEGAVGVAVGQGDGDGDSDGGDKILEAGLENGEGGGGDGGCPISGGIPPTLPSAKMGITPLFYGAQPQKCGAGRWGQSLSPPFPVTRPKCGSRHPKCGSRPPNMGPAPQVWVSPPKYGVPTGIFSSSFLQLRPSVTDSRSCHARRPAPKSPRPRARCGSTSKRKSRGVSSFPAGQKVTRSKGRGGAGRGRAGYGSAPWRPRPPA